MTTAYYLTTSFLSRIADFFNHWYVGGFRLWGYWTISFLEALDRRLAFKITLKYIFQPLYQDNSFIGYALGFVFRCLRLIAGTIIYGVILIIAIAIYIFWAIIPAYIILKIIDGLIIYQ